MKNYSKIGTLGVIIFVTLLLFNPGWIIIFLATGLKIAVIVAILNLVSRLIFHRSIWSIIMEEK